MASYPDDFQVVRLPLTSTYNPHFIEVPDVFELESFAWIAPEAQRAALSPKWSTITSVKYSFCLRLGGRRDEIDHFVSACGWPPQHKRHATRQVRGTLGVMDGCAVGVAITILV